MWENPFVFVVGCARSGTTLLQRMLDNHPELAVANDTCFIPHAVTREKVATDPPLTAEMVQAVISDRRFPRLGVPEATALRLADGALTYGDYVRRLYDEFARLHGKPLGGEKTPYYVRHLPLLYRLFPSAKLIHIIRDGRDVALSNLEWANENRGPGRHALWSKEPLAACALWWRWSTSRGRDWGRGISSEIYREVIYEELVADPERVLRELAEFLGLPFAQEMVDFYVGKERSDPGLSAKKAWRPATVGLRDWRKSLSAEDLALFDALAGDMLTELGYPPGVSDIPQEIRHRAARCRDVWETERARRTSRADANTYSPNSNVRHSITPTPTALSPSPPTPSP